MNKAFLIQKILLNLKCLFLFSRKKRNDLKIDFVKKQIKENLRFGITYSVWDGEELLEASIKSIRNQVDYINVVWQELSWQGNKCDEGLLPLLNSLKEQGLIDEIIEYKPNLKLSPKKNECAKRNLGLKYIKKAKCDYFMPMDVDEFYIEKDFENAKEKIVLNNITHSYVPYCDYWVKPTLKSVESTHYCYVTFLSKVGLFTKFGKNKEMPCLVDPTRSPVHTSDAKYYVLENIVMHHMSNVRKDMIKKLKNTSGNTSEAENWQRHLETSIEERIKNGEIAVVPNIFNINVN